MRTFFFGGRKRKVGSIVTGLALFGAAVGLAVSFFLGVYSGNAGGHVASSQTIGSLTLTPNYIGNLVPGGTADAGYTVNNPTSGTVTITDVTTGTFFIDNAPACNGATAIHFNTSGIVGSSFPPGNTTVVLPNAWSADANLTTACQGSNFNIALSGATSGTGA
jgi:hypothetical protein